MHDMYEQPKYKPQAPTDLFADGSSARAPPEGTLTATFGTAAVVDATAGADKAPAITLPFLQRGRERFDIYCAPCHGRDGDGAGMVVMRGFPAPPSYHSENLRAAPDSHIYDVITNGYGVMYPYADRITPQDRWAIVAYIRALQLSRRAPSNLLTPADLARLDQQGPR